MIGSVWLADLKSTFNAAAALPQPQTHAPRYSVLCSPMAALLFPEKLVRLQRGATQLTHQLRSFTTE
jgi:hypothetical protein